MAKFKKLMVKWGLSAAKVGLAGSILVAPALSAQASEFHGFDELGFGSSFSEDWNGLRLFGSGLESR